MNTPTNTPLERSLRSKLEAAVKAAREAAEKGARAALSQLAVGDSKAPSYLSDELKSLRRRLRAHGRALGDAKASDDSQAIQHLVWEVAYEHWHRMLFARFLAENGLLLWEPGAAVSLDDCEALVQETDPAMNLGAKTKWELAGKLAARMLPQVFKPASPVFELVFAPEHQRELERLLAGLSSEVFKASDSLGWVYQFWQAKRKDEVNASELKIGADELPAVTQLFTEPYMVDFLLHNSLGAWWLTRQPGKPCPVPLTYLRTLDDGTPAAGKFEGWPNNVKDFTLLDPCCGSGHFLVAAFLLLVPMRMAAEGLSAVEAVDAVLADNLHGLEIDARCVEIAVFALALTAWRFPDEQGDPLGVRADMPAPQIACCGLKVAAKPEDWMALVPDDAANAIYLRQELRLLHASFAQAPLLGSLLDPARSLKNDLATSSFDTLRDLLGIALATERPATLWGQASELQDDSWDLAVTAKGMLDAAHLLNARYDLVITNVPYLKSGNHSDCLKDFLDAHYSRSSYDLATVFMERCLEMTKRYGSSAIVTQQYWLFLKYYESLRGNFIEDHRIDMLAILGPGAFATIGGEVVNPCLQIYARQQSDANHHIRGLDVSKYKKASEKAEFLRSEEVCSVLQLKQKQNPNNRISLSSLAHEGETPLSKIADFGKGSVSGDGFHYIRCFWEIFELTQDFRYWLNSPDHSDFVGGRQNVVLWSVPGHDMTTEVGCAIRGQRAWGKKGIAIGKAGKLRPTLYAGELFDDNLAVLIPYNQINLAALWNFCTSPSFEQKLKQLDKKMSVTAGTFTKVSVDISSFNVEQEKYSLPAFQSPDPTQWLFHGHPNPATDPLQVAVARLVGYRWPAETDASVELSDESRTWIARCEQLAEHVDDDGIVCLPSVRGEPAAHDRLLKLLIAAWETVQPGSWKPTVLDKLLADADCAGKGLDVWLRDKFFEQHAKRFHHRPFIWQVWDGLKDGFSALVNYHQLDAKNLERLIHTYLGDWIRQQEDGMRHSVDGAQTRLAAAQDLKRRLERILEGEKPYDIFVRWKTLDEQAIGWNPDLNDGVRMNIRPFMTAEVLRHNKKPKLNITWDKDRGKDVESAPWFKQFGGDRINDHHLSLAEKRAAQTVKAKG